eukprot:COSAG01_NODE_1147_length_11515_cov_38.979694_6_plen_107_part_00
MRTDALAAVGNQYIYEVSASHLQRKPFYVCLGLTHARLDSSAQLLHRLLLDLVQLRVQLFDGKSGRVMLLPPFFDTPIHDCTLTGILQRVAEERRITDRSHHPQHY